MPAMETVYFYNGARGGLGKHLGPALEELGARSIPLRARLEDVESLRQEVRDSLRGSGPRRAIFLQLASLVSVPACEKDPELAEKINVEGVFQSVVAFIEETRALGSTPEILYVSSGHLYAPKASGRIKEDDPLAPRSVYARTKLAAESVLTEFCRTSSVRLSIARVFGLVAPNQPPNYVLPGLIRRAREKELVGIPGLDNERDYLDARDVCRALVRIATRPSAGVEVLNVCSGEAVTIRQVMELALRKVHGNEEGRLLAQALTAGPSRPDDITSIVGDPSRYVAETGEAPKRIPLGQTISEAIDA
jgi:nucleoside-diphosphate-sugar epimerase